MDESGTPPKPDQQRPAYFVVAGVSIPEAVWAPLRDAMFGMKVRRRLRGELKWRYFSASNEDTANPMRALCQDERDEIRTELYKTICSFKGLRAIASVVSAEAAYAIPSVHNQEDIYHLAYKTVTERFQYHLQDLSRSLGERQYGIVIADHRGSGDDRLLRQVHQKLLHSTGETISRYDNLIEGLFLTPSHLSIGVQVADLLAGAIWRKFERGDARWYEQIVGAFRRGPDGQVDGYGLIKAPKRGWR